jgi:hypothetical protein
VASGRAELLREDPIAIVPAFKGVNA